MILHVIESPIDDAIFPLYKGIYICHTSYLQVVNKHPAAAIIYVTESCDKSRDQIVHNMPKFSQQTLQYLL